MARIQVLELPDVHHADGTYETPFVIVFDQASDAIFGDGTEDAQSFGVWRDGFALRTGARAVLVTADTIDIPANDWTLAAGPEDDSAPAAGVVRLRVVPDLTGFIASVDEQISAAHARITRYLGTKPGSYADGAFPIPDDMRPQRIETEPPGQPT